MQSAVHGTGTPLPLLDIQERSRLYQLPAPVGNATDIITIMLLLFRLWSSLCTIRNLRAGGRQQIPDDTLTAIYCLRTVAWAAASLAMGTRNGEHET